MSTSTTCAPSACNASVTLSADFSETFRSEPGPPFRTAILAFLRFMGKPCVETEGFLTGIIECEFMDRALKVKINEQFCDANRIRFFPDAQSHRNCVTVPRRCENQRGWS